MSRIRHRWPRSHHVLDDMRCRASIHFSLQLCRSAGEIHSLVLGADMESAPVMSRMRVLLPLPLRPMIAVREPGSMLSVTSCSTCRQQQYSEPDWSCGILSNFSQEPGSMLSTTSCSTCRHHRPKSSRGEPLC